MIDDRASMPEKDAAPPGCALPWGSLRAAVASLVVVVFLLAAAGSTLFYLQRSAQGELERARADIANVVDYATKNHRDRSEQLNAVTNAKLSAEESVRTWPPIWLHWRALTR
ncbi:hypothetical protein [Nocardia sp. NRRL S-836]|uniref:hypothetical protein n=1 Tax=Nocardia sp. NRRL S-836 TaxID=1519492 RepID=UPI0012FB2A29|nr:hypothetical protein [Nocardia sp. NRRL S-836]